jgi:hypothetical protein
MVEASGTFCGGQAAAAVWGVTAATDHGGGTEVVAAKFFRPTERGLQ